MEKKVKHCSCNLHAASFYIHTFAGRTLTVEAYKLVKSLKRIAGSNPAPP